MITKDMKWCEVCKTRTKHDPVRKGIVVCRYCRELGRAIERNRENLN